jgi:hypothetical protein
MKFKHLRVSGQRLVKWPAGCTGSPWLRRTRSPAGSFRISVPVAPSSTTRSVPLSLPVLGRGTNGVHLQGSNPSPDVSCGIRRT